MRYCDDGRLEPDNPAERTLCSVARGRKNYLFAGSNAGGGRARNSNLNKRPKKCLEPR